MTRPMSEEREKILRAAEALVDIDRQWKANEITGTQYCLLLQSYLGADSAIALARALLSTSSAERGMREALAEDLGMVEHDGALLLLPAPAEERHCFECTSRSACRNNGLCGLGWHNTHSIRAYRAALSSKEEG